MIKNGVTRVTVPDAAIDPKTHRATLATTLRLDVATHGENRPSIVGFDARHFSRVDKYEVCLTAANGLAAFAAPLIAARPDGRFEVAPSSDQATVLSEKEAAQSCTRAWSAGIGDGEWASAHYASPTGLALAFFETRPTEQELILAVAGVENGPDAPE